ncbi:MAG: DUF2723 domain-containing protein [Bacteroidales bacterium]|nr:DUF2723 domain-containing protein [Bacteroidales bacterium]MCF8351438.1 DUF2723 domain-containing protein [Bacteroidales bacterium]MCF8374781.1 DUF2723 domain-containing protein [Bacteroidales bacterium]MCF8399815.1 DUF2723 domain-containing protein [Bacteroidales bacterium]
MKNFKLYNNIGGWFVFLVATIVYFMTLEPTASWWDCGEYIATAYKLQVGHPPGAPLFQLLGRFFSMFAFGNEANVAMMVNAMSALSSSFTILFLFWTISMLAHKVVAKEGEMTEGKMYAVLGSAFIGAMAFTFSDSFWFSAVEGEVYAMSSLFTAIVFWAILRWERVADYRHGYRWLILIAYLIGLSIGVHLLILLAIPAISFVYYFKKYKNVSWKGMLVTFLVSIVILSAIMYVIIPLVVRLSSVFELFFVNSLGLPFNTGTIIYFVVLIGLIVWALKYTRRKRRVILNTVMLGLVFILIGYSSFFMLVIRSNADVPIDENNPEDAISLLSYLNREQYGDWPIVSGQYFNAPVVDAKDGNPIYIKNKEKGKYVITDDRKNTIPVYDDEYTTIFPRMWSKQKPGHIDMYLQYGGIDESRVYYTRTRPDGSTVVNRQGEIVYNRNKPKNPPTFGQNLRFFFSYQLGHMYFRYFMWNFAGRQNDIESQGEPEHGNWISGIGFLDKSRIGDLEHAPETQGNPAHNKFYLLPFILGLIGFFFHLGKTKRDFLVVFLLFIMTGIAIVMYLNQYPYQPRERDYAYAGSFYAFAIWIGLGVLAIFDGLKKQIKQHKPLAIGIAVVCFMLVPFIMAQQGWDDHDRSGKYAARDFAFNYLESCDEDAVLFTNGDNDTFPLWYAQEVEGKRTDVRVVNYMLASGAWYIHQLGRKIYDSEKIPLTLNPDQYNKGVNMYTEVIKNRSNDNSIVRDIRMQFIDEFYRSNQDSFEDRYQDLINDLISIFSESDVEQIRNQELNQVQRQGTNLPVNQFLRYLSLRSKDNAEKFGINRDKMMELFNTSQTFIDDLIESPMDVDYVVAFLADDNDNRKRIARSREMINYVPTDKIRVFVDTVALAKSNLVPEKWIDDIEPYIDFRISQNAIYKNDLMFLDFMASNDWERPIYFANPSSMQDIFSATEYCHLDGIVHKVLPVKSEHYMEGFGGIDTDETYDLLQNKAKWGCLHKPDVNVDRESSRTSLIIKQDYRRLAEALLKEGKPDSARMVMDTCFHYFPLDKFPIDYYSLPFIDVYYRAGDQEKAEELVNAMTDYCLDKIRFFRSTGQETSTSEEMQRALYYLNMLSGLVKEYGREELGTEIDSIMNNEMVTFGR